MTEQQPAPELKPCPFCGTAAVISYDGQGGLVVRCDSQICAVYPEVQAETENEQWAIRTWNTRADLLQRVPDVYYLDSDHSIYEDDLPRDISKSMYDQWFERSRIVDGVRMGPAIEKRQPTAPCPFCASVSVIAWGSEKDGEPCWCGFCEDCHSGRI